MGNLNSMPHIRFRAVEERQVQQLSDSLLKPLAAALETTEDNFTFELVPSRFFFGGKPTPAYPFVEVLWFKRSAEIAATVAEILNSQVKAATKATDVAVVFQALPESDYFENGKHF